MPLNLNTNVYHRRTQLINHVHVWTPLDSLEALQSVLEDL